MIVVVKFILFHMYKLAIISTIFINVTLLICQTQSIKTIYPTLYYPRSEIKLISDSVNLDGYFIFETSKIKDFRNFENDSPGFFRFDIYFLKDLQDIQTDSLKYSYNPLHGHFMYYSDLSVFSLDTVGGSISYEVIKNDSLKYNNYIQYQKVYFNYNARRNSEVAAFFLDTLSNSFFRGINFYKINTVTSAFIFKVNIDAAVIEFDSYYLNESNRKVIDRERRRNILPIKQVNFIQEVDIDIMERNKFTKSDWLPPNLF